MKIMNLSKYSVESLSKKEIKTVNGGGEWATLLGNVVGFTLSIFPPTAVAINAYHIYQEW